VARLKELGDRFGVGAPKGRPSVDATHE